MKVALMVIALLSPACGGNNSTPADGGSRDATTDGAAAADNGCGNQTLFATGGNYNTLAEVLADDVLTIDTKYGLCGYLDLELGIASSCGGRIPTDDVVDFSYSILAAGKATGIGDGVDQDDVGVDGQFPFLRPAVQ